MLVLIEFESDIDCVCFSLRDAVGKLGDALDAFCGSEHRFIHHDIAAGVDDFG